MRKIALIATLFLSLAAGAQAQAPTPTPEETLAAMVGWLDRNTQYKNLKPPKWGALSLEQLRTVSMNRNHSTGDGVVAMYFCDSQTMFVRSDLDWNTLFTWSFLIHELVHHGQCEAHRFRTDHCAAEREAYAIQAGFVRSIIPLLASEADKTTAAKAADGLKVSADKACAGFLFR